MRGTPYWSLKLAAGGRRARAAQHATVAIAPITSRLNCVATAPGYHGTRTRAQLRFVIDPPEMGVAADRLLVTGVIGGILTKRLGADLTMRTYRAVAWPSPQPRVSRAPDQLDRPDLAATASGSPRRSAPTSCSAWPSCILYRGHRGGSASRRESVRGHAGGRQVASADLASMRLARPRTAQPTDIKGGAYHCSRGDARSARGVICSPMIVI